MHYEKLSNITERYPIVYNNSYNEAVHNVKICSMEFNVEGMISEFERFLGAWHSLRRPLDKNKMKDVWIKEIEPYSKVLEGELLESLDTDKIIQVGGETLRTGIAIEHMYAAMTVLPGINKTNASKLLHLRLPFLFVMTDKDIRYLFKLFAGEAFSPYSYTFTFLMLVKSHINEAVESLCGDKKLTREQGIDFLQNLHGRKRSLAKLIDECYFTFAHNPQEFPQEYHDIFLGGNHSIP